MQEVITQMEARCSLKEGEKLQLLTLNNLDGRTSAVRRIKEWESQIITDLGGDLTEAQKSIMRRAAVLSAILEDKEARWATGTPLSLNEYCSATNVLRRLLSTLGMERKQKSVNGTPLPLGQS